MLVHEEAPPAHPLQSENEEASRKPSKKRSSGRPSKRISSSISSSDSEIEDDPPSTDETEKEFFDHGSGDGGNYGSGEGGTGYGSGDNGSVGDGGEAKGLSLYIFSAPEKLPKFDGNHLLSIENSLKISSNIEICSKILVSINFANLYPPLEGNQGIGY